MDGGDGEVSLRRPRAHVVKPLHVAMRGRLHSVGVSSQLPRARVDPSMGLPTPAADQFVRGPVTVTFVGAQFAICRGRNLNIEIMQDSPKLRRTLTLWPLIFYGMGVIVGAGVYVALGTVIARAGEAAPLCFLVAGVTACLTGLCYAELAGRYPEAAGAAAFAGHGFRSDRAAVLVGAVMALTIALAAASITGGAVHYLAVLLPIPPLLLAPGMIIVVTAIAALGVRESVGLAAALGALEIVGLLAATVAGLWAAPDYDMTGMIPRTLDGWRGVAAGAFIAFFAFVGFETLANMAEEVKEPTMTVPRSIIGAIGASLVLYVGVAIAVVLADRGGGTRLLDLFEGRNKTAFAMVGFLSVANGVLVEIIMLARLLYGMADKGRLPAVLAYVHPKTMTPVVATGIAGLVALAAVLTAPFERLLIVTNTLTLGVFLVVDVALCLIQWREPAKCGGFSVPRAVPPLAAVLTASIMIVELAG
jgi:APA family basic amino acid/polyamine antiporter